MFRFSSKTFRCGW